ncbi:MAG: hypothetical protein AAFX81_16070 [Pseudomonadota bacterium]
MVIRGDARAIRDAAKFACGLASAGADLIPIYRTVRIDAGPDGAGRITACTGAQQVRSSLPCRIDSADPAAAVGIDGQALQRILGQVAGPVVLRCFEARITVEGQGLRGWEPPLWSEHWPLLPASDGAAAVAELQPEALRQALVLAAEAAPTSDGRSNLHGVAVTWAGDTLVVRASDGAYAQHFEMPAVARQPAAAFLALATARLLHGLVGDHWRLAIVGPRLHVTAGDTEVTAQLQDAEFPAAALDGLLAKAPGAAVAVARLDAGAARAALQRCLWARSTKSSAGFWLFSGGSLRQAVMDQESAREAVADVPLRDGPPAAVGIGVNVKHIERILASFVGEVTVYVPPEGERASPLLFEGPGHKALVTALAALRPAVLNEEPAMAPVDMPAETGGEGNPDDRSDDDVDADAAGSGGAGDDPQSDAGGRRQAARPPRADAPRGARGAAKRPRATGR